MIFAKYEAVSRSFIEVMLSRPSTRIDGGSTTPPRVLVNDPAYTRSICIDAGQECGSVDGVRVWQTGIGTLVMGSVAIQCTRL